MAIDILETFSFPYCVRMLRVTTATSSTAMYIIHIRNTKKDQHIQQERTEGAWGGGVA